MWMRSTICRSRCRISTARPYSSGFRWRKFWPSSVLRIGKGRIAARMPSISRHLLPFIEAYFDKSNSDINQKLRRRLHWLAD